MIPEYRRRILQEPYGIPPRYTEAVWGYLIMPDDSLTEVPLGPRSTHMICPHCHVEIDTMNYTVSKESKQGLFYYVSTMIILLVGSLIGCCFIPSWLQPRMEVLHICPYCDEYLGAYKTPS
ncbi:LITAF domain-containing protein [Leptinotarsa decemlineata]|uniref:LITAF domain-containing protein n=1 Tax=Leptinotarsa decemlineata TaxID=7539 RepID=UPI000C252110|nr:lipopolysaccharide-induced tumor necrosis factor-alpha factor homolog [Leptinotarsa decemlineata]